MAGAALLVAIVGKLVELVKRLEPGPEARAVRQRHAALVARLS